MSKRTLDLIEELKLAFGRTFGTVAPSKNDDLLEAFELAEARPQSPPQKAPSKKVGKGGGGGRRGGGGGFPPKKGGPTITQKKLKRAAEKSRKQKDADGDSAFGNAMADIRGDMDKSKAKSKVGSDGFSSQAMRTSKARKDANVHHPFKHSSSRGVGPRGKSDRQTKCWSCTCHGGIYKSGCECRASGNGENCPDKGTIKKIAYKPSYHRAYNDEYHAWRKKQTRFNKR